MQQFIGENKLNLIRRGENSQDADPIDKDDEQPGKKKRKNNKHKKKQRKNKKLMSQAS